MNHLIFPLKTGDVTLPDDTGNYVISPGCGAGKTYSMARFAVAHKDEGILIAVDSIKSANTIYGDLLALRIPEDEMLLIHSQTDFSIQNHFAMHPEDATKKKVLIMTNVRLYTGFPPAYLLYGRNGVKLCPFDGNWSSLMNNPTLRRYIFIDEIPGFIQCFASVSKAQLGVLSDPDGAAFKAKDEVKMRNAYFTFLSGTSNAFFDDTTTLGRLKSETVLAIIRRDYSQMMKTKECFDIQFSPCDFATSHSLVIIMEGAGDILFKNSSVYKIVDMPDKYTGNVDFKQFLIPGLKRAQGELKKMVKQMASKVKGIISKASGQTLVVCWKDIKGSNINTGDDASDSPLVKMLGDELSAFNLDQERYSIIYYGSADSRAVNTYKDYANIILVGKWSLPVSSSAHKFKKAFNTDTSLTRYMLWEYVQLITRTRIRLGGNINVFFSSDHDLDFMAALSDYFNKNRLDIREERRNWKSRLKNIPYGARQIETIEKLSQRFPKIIKKITGRGKSLDITLSISEMNKVIGQRRSSKKYTPLIKILKKFGINLTITI